jgi:hypothetical protein
MHSVNLRMGGLQRRSGLLGEVKQFCVIPGIKTEFLGSPTTTLVFTGAHTVSRHKAFRADTEALLNCRVVYDLDFRSFYAVYKTKFGIGTK